MAGRRLRRALLLCSPTGATIAAKLGPSANCRGLRGSGIMGHVTSRPRSGGWELVSWSQEVDGVEGRRSARTRGGAHMVHGSRGRRSRGVLKVGVLGSALALALLVAGPGFFSTASMASPGNNGTVKVDGVPFDQHTDNEPHPGCSFEITFFDFDP